MSEVRKKRKHKELMEWAISFIIVIVVAFVIRTFIVCPVVVKGISMEPNFYHGNILLVDRISYRFSEPEINDIVVCDQEISINEKKIIKRVVGLPGDTIDFRLKDDNHYVLVLNGEEMEEDYIKENMKFLGDISLPYVVGEDEYFVMGDNRNESFDSRYTSIGAIKKDKIAGKIFISIKPFGKIE